MRKHIKDESIDLVYIDPPFNSKRNYNQIYNNVGGDDKAQAQAFVDTWTWDDHANECFSDILANKNGVQTRQSIELISGLERVLTRGAIFAYLVSMTIRIAELYRTLKPTGSFYLHCDPSASHYLKLVCDALFLPRGGDYRNEIVWQRHEAHNDAQRFGRVHDIIFYYRKSDEAVFNRQFTEYSEAQLKRYKYDDKGRPYRAENLTGAGTSPERTVEWRGVHPGANRHWMWSIEEMERLYDQGLILLKKDGTPRKDGYKVYLENMQGKALTDLWNDIPRIGNTSAERLGYPTQKPEALLERIIGASSHEGDVVLDAFCGCGTTVAVAEGMKRRWIGMDITYQSISLVLRRLERKFDNTVLNSITVSGVPKDMASAIALANKKDDRLRKEFEKWAVLTYTNNRAIISEKKGADQGIDGTGYFKTGKDEIAKIVFQVKSGGVERGDIAKLRGDMDREQAPLAILITLVKPTNPMVKEAKAAGQYHHESMGRNYDKIQIVTVQEIVEEGKRLEIPMSLEVLKAAKRDVEDKQQPLF